MFGIKCGMSNDIENSLQVKQCQSLSPIAIS